jgi:LTXXQ motif family protein
MFKIVRVLLITAGLILTVGETHSFAQFGGRGGLGGIFGGMPRGGRGDRGDNTQTRGSRVERPVPDSYEQTEHNLMLLQVDLRLAPEQQGLWQSFTQKVLAYAGDLSRERSRIGIPVPEGTTITGLKYIDQATDNARNRLTELEDIRGAANALYATLSPEQKKIADARMATIIAPRPSVSTGSDSSAGYSDLDSSGAKTRH